MFILSTFIADAATFILKLLINRPRPTDTLVTIYQKLGDPSFPSAHVVHYVVFFGLLSVAIVEAKKVSRISADHYRCHFVATHTFHIYFTHLSWRPLGNRCHRRISYRLYFPLNTALFLF